MGKPYPNCWGLQKSMVNLWAIVGDDSQKRALIGKIFGDHRRDLDDLLTSNLPLDFQRRAIVWLKHWYHKRIFEDIKCLEDTEKRHLYSAIMGHQREAHRELHK